MSVKANGRYMTWWNAKRINSRIKYTELVELLGLKQSQMGQLSGYFIGKVMPKEDMIRKIADLFDVPYDEAYSHFFSDWGGNKSKNPVKTFSAPDDISDNAIENTDKDNVEIPFRSWDDPEIRKEVDEVMDHYKTDIKEDDEIMDDYKAAPMSDRESILKKVYGVVDYETYILIDKAILTGSYNETLKIIYGKVSFDIYDLVSKIFIQKGGLICAS